MATRVSENLSATIASGDVLDVRSFEVQEGLSKLFSVDLTVVSDNADIDFEAVVGQDASFSVTARGRTRTFSGVAARMSQLAVEDSGQSSYHLEIVPTAWLLTHRRNHRMFQRQSEPEMVKKLLGEWGIELEDRLTETYKKRKYRVQYGETDFAFISRMLEDAGITYFFEVKDGATKMVLTDAPQKAEARAPSPRFYDQPSNDSDADWVTGVRVSRKVQPGKYTMRDVDHRRPPTYNLRGTATAQDAAGVEGKLERFHYVPGAFLFDDDKGEATPHADDKGKYRTDEVAGNMLAERRLAARRGEARPVSFDTNCLDVQAGTVLSIADHPRSDLGDDKPLLITEVLLRGDSEGQWLATCEARDAARPFRPEVQTPKPKVSGVESATVVGPPGEEIHTDEFGRVRVHFHWDRESKMDDDSSCWIPVSQPWGGAGYGGTNLPRVGQEVIIDFLGGDPDRPIILGRVYTNLQKTPYKLPANKTQSGWKSNSTGNTGGYNELMFEDKAGSELLRMQAEKDMTALVKNDKQETVGRDRTRLVKRNEAVTVGKNRTKSVVGNEASTIGQNMSLAVGANRSTQVGAIDSTLVGQSYVLRISPPSEGGGGGADTTQYIEHDKIVLSTPGGASITLEGDTITLKASKITVQADTNLAAASMGEASFVGLAKASLLGATVNVSGPKVNINGPGRPSARVTDLAPGIILTGASTVLVGDGPFVTGLGTDIDTLIAMSPTLTEILRKLSKDGWTIRYGEPGKGTYCDRNKKELVIDPNQKGNPTALVQSLSHEAGHANYTPDAYVPPDGLTRDEYVSRNANRSLKDEGEATMTNADVRSEILNGGGPDIGIAGAQGDQYQAIHDKYTDPADRDKARQEIGDLFADGEHPSTDPSKTYRDYYSQGFEDYWDKNVKGP